jgi:hypothetical protein
VLLVSSQQPMGNAGPVGIPRAQNQDRPASRYWLWAIAVAAIAFLVRLVPVLRGGGLMGIGNYDDGVYYAAATGLIHGLLPYQDYLLLHPPGMPVLLAPFALLAQLIGDSNGFAVARLAWMLLGAVNAVLVWKILRPVGMVAAVFGGLGYAVFYPAVYVEKSTLLESPATTALLLAMLLLQPLVHDRSLPPGKAFAAGALLGLAMTIKVWGVVTVLIVLGWLLLLRRYGAALRVMIGSAVAATVICLPFFAAAPTAMWNQIVRDQVSRGRRSSVTILERLHEMAGLGIVDRSLPTAITVAAVAALLCCAALAWSYREARLAVLHTDLVRTFRGLYRRSDRPHRRRGNRPLDRTDPSQTRPDRSRRGRRRRAVCVRGRLGNSHLQPPVPRPLPSVHSCHPRMRHVGRRRCAGRDRFAKPQSESRLPVHCRSWRPLPRHGGRRGNKGVTQPQPSLPGVRAGLPAQR